MKTSLLPIIAYAMTVFALPPSPFIDMASAINDFDAVVAVWEGDLLAIPGMISANHALNKSIDTTCATPLFLQPDDTQEQWFNDAKSFLDILDGCVDLCIDKIPTIDNAIRESGRTVGAGMAQYQSKIPGCIQDFSSAFSADNQQALNAVGDNATEILQAGIDAFTASS